MLGATNAILMVRLARGRRRSVVAPVIAAEALVGVAVILAAGVLAAGSPAHGPQFAPPRPVRAAALSAGIGDVLVEASVRPNRPGENTVAVQAVSTRRPPPAPIESVQVRAGAGSVPVRMTPLEPGQYIATVNLARPGRSELSVVLSRGGRSLTSNIPWSIDQPDPARPVVVSAARLSAIVDPIALGLLVFLALGALGVWLGAGHGPPLRAFALYRQEPS
jgi:copper transport protein